MAYSVEQASEYMAKLLAAMAQLGGSDLFISAGFPPSMKSDGEMRPMSDQLLTGEVTRRLAEAIMTDNQAKAFERDLECNFAVEVEGGFRFRVNAYMQQKNVAMVARAISSKIPTMASAGVPEALGEIAMRKRGLVLVVGSTGSGKSTTLAALIDHRNTSSKGHIVTIEDPIEYVHPSKGCLVSHREVGVDTRSWEAALKSALRQAPDVIMIGEIRDAEAMEHALTLSETGHLCFGTLHANDAIQAIDRIVNFFPPERREQTLMGLASNIQAVVSQRLVKRADGDGRMAAFEVLLATPSIKDLIFKGSIGEIRSAMESQSSSTHGMATFDSSLLAMYDSSLIDYHEAIRHADSATNLKLAIKTKSARGEPKAPSAASILAVAHDPREDAEARLAAAKAAAGRKS